MATYEVENTIVKTENATNSYEEDRDWNGRNHIGRSIGSEWRYETLHRSRRGRYYTEAKSATQGEEDQAEWLSPEAAVRWLTLNGYALPNELADAAERVTE